MIAIHLIATELIAIKFGNKSVPQWELASIVELIKSLTILHVLERQKGSLLYFQTSFWCEWTKENEKFICSNENCLAWNLKDIQNQWEPENSRTGRRLSDNTH